jgi:hypothetical protein
MTQISFALLSSAVLSIGSSQNRFRKVYGTDRSLSATDSGYVRLGL